MTRDRKLTREEIVLRVNDLINNNNNRISKYKFDYSLYNQCPGEDLQSKNPNTVGLVDDIYSQDSIVPKLNVIKSAIDSVVSKMSTAHCRPFVNAIKGSFKTIQVCKQLQVFFDYYFDEQNIQEKIVEAVRDACIFDSGFLYFDEVTGDVSVVQPWNIYTKQIEKKDFKSVYVEFPWISTDKLKDEDFNLLTADEQKLLYIQKLGYFYDSRSKTKAIIINRNIRKIEELKSSELPVVPIYYTAPILGNTSLSIADMLRGIQSEIDELMKRIADASVLNPAQTYFLSNASNIKVAQLNNKVGNVVMYNSQGGQPVSVSTPAFISDQYMALLDNLIEKAYNMVGISQLSAQGKKPSGLDSGVALATQADIESDRFQVLLDQYIGMFTATAKKAVKLFADNKTIIEPNRYNLRLTWGDVEKEWDKMRVQFSGADSLSKDPSEKLKQLQTLAQAGIIPATQIASLLEIPDIARGYSVANNGFNAAMTLIDSCIYEGKMDLPEYVPLEMLKEQIVNMELSLRAASTDGSNDEDIARLQEYFSKIEDAEEQMATESSMQAQANAQDVNQNNMYSAQNNSQFGNGTEDNLNMTNEAVANPYDVGADNGGELDNPV